VFTRRATRRAIKKKWFGSHGPDNAANPYILGVLVLIGLALLGINKIVQCRADRATEEAEAKADAEDAVLVSALRKVYVRIPEVTTGPAQECPREVTAVAIVSQPWLAGFLLNVNAKPDVPITTQTLAFKQLTSGWYVSSEERVLRNKRYEQLAASWHVGVFIATEVDPIRELVRTDTEASFSTGRLHGQIVIVELASNTVVCRVDVHVETQPFAARLFRNSLGELTVFEKVEDHWTEPFRKAADAALTEAAPHARFIHE